jgi:hypothetical protein
VAATLPPALTILAARVDRAVPAARVVPADPAIILVVQVGREIIPVAQADPVDRVIIPVAQADPVDRVIIPVARVDPVDRVVPATTPGGRVDQVITPVGPTDSADQILTLAGRGTGTPSVVTSAGRRGATGLDRGGRVRRRGRHGIDRSPRPVGTGITARSITGATRKHPSGIPVSTSGVSGSSECGSRCDR